MIPFEEIDPRLDALGENREWLAKITKRSPGAIRSALAPNASEKHRSALLQKALSDAIEAEEKARSARPALPDRINLEPNKDEFHAWCQAYKASPHDLLEEWAIDALNRAAHEWKIRKDAKLGGAIVNMPEARTSLPFFGAVAAGNPAGFIPDVTDDTVSVAGSYGADHFALRVNGRSMEPEYPDGSLIICRSLKVGEFATKGDDVIACDAYGVYFKRLLYTKEGKKGDKPRKATPHLVSINPEYNEVVPVADCPVRAVVVAKA